MLVKELRELGVQDAAADQHGIVLATIPGNVKRSAPTIAFIAHLDTSPETTGHNVKPIVHRDYDGRDIVLPGDPSKVIRVADNPELLAMKGKTLITTDGTTLLGADDKAGVAVIMEAAATLMAHPEIPHGAVRICFTCDEEIGHGVDHLDLKKLGAARRLHARRRRRRARSTARPSPPTWRSSPSPASTSTRPSPRGGWSTRSASPGRSWIGLPWQALSPETTDGRDGFLHPYRIEGGVGEVTLRILLRDFDTAKLAEKAELLRNHRRSAARPSTRGRRSR